MLTLNIYDFQVFKGKTKKVLESKEFLAANIETVKVIFAQEDVIVESELDFVRALEAYIDHHKDTDPEIVTKIRPALNFIRFLTLSPGDLAQSTLLTPVEVRDVIICQVSDSGKMPVGFSQNKYSRGIEMRRIRYPGTSIAKFHPPIDTDQDEKGREILIYQHCITFMSEYESKSLEELRYEDYMANRKYVSNSVD